MLICTTVDFLLHSSIIVLLRRVGSYTVNDFFYKGWLLLQGYSRRDVPFHESLRQTYQDLLEQARVSRDDKECTNISEKIQYHDRIIRLLK